MKKRILSLLLAGAMALSLAACGGNGDDTKDTSDSKDTTISDANSDYAGIEKKNYEKDFYILYPDWANYKYYFFTEENSGEAMDVALFNRELKIEEHLGINIEYVMANNNGENGIGAIYPNMQQMAMTGDNLYQITLTHCIQDLAVMITDGLLEDLNTIETIDFDNDWWNQKSNDNLSVNGKQYYAVSDYNIPDIEVMVFNKKMIENNHLENPYDIVNEGKWTIDKLMEMSSAVTQDNGDGNWDYNDTYGFGAPSAHMLTGFTYSCGLTLVDKDSDGFFTFGLNNQKAYSVVEKLQQLFESTDTYIYPWSMDNIGHTNYNPTESLNIASGRSLFNLYYLSSLADLRETEVEFGILPYPKFDENQEDYVTVDWSGLMCVPLLAQDKEMIGEVLELYGCLAGDEVLPAFYDIMLGEKLSRDPESRDMLDLIFDSIVFDAGMNYFGFGKNMTKFWNLGDAISKGEFSGYASFLGQYEEATIAEIEEFNNALAD